MKPVRSSLRSILNVSLLAALAACSGGNDAVTADRAEGSEIDVGAGGAPSGEEPVVGGATSAGGGTPPAASTGGTSGVERDASGGARDAAGGATAPGTSGEDDVPPPSPPSVVGASGGARGSGGAKSAPAPRPETLGTGSVRTPAVGPAPKEGAKVGTGWVLVKNWNFGTTGTVRDLAALGREWMYHDQFGTIGNGPNYGAVTVAPDRESAIEGQPIEDPARPYREFTAEALRTYVRPLSPAQETVSAAAHDAGNGSIAAKWTLPRAGSGLGKDILWESRVRMPETRPGYWFAIWTSGNRWDEGAEMDVLESFGTPNIYPPPAAFHVNSVGGRDRIDYTDWPGGLTAAGVPESARDLRQWHTFTWVYERNDTYVVYFDGHLVQEGAITWTVGGAPDGERIDLTFLYDFGWGHTKVSQVNLTLPATGFRIVYELDYSRVYLR